MKLDKTALQITDKPCLVSAPVICACKATVLLVSSAPRAPWLCPLCGRTYRPEFQHYLDSKDLYSYEVAVTSGCHPYETDEVDYTLWDVIILENLVLMLGNSACRVCGQGCNPCGCR